MGLQVTDKATKAGRRGSKETDNAHGKKRAKLREALRRELAESQRERTAGLTREASGRGEEMGGQMKDTSGESYDVPRARRAKARKKLRLDLQEAQEGGTDYWSTHEGRERHLQQK